LERSLDASLENGLWKGLGKKSMRRRGRGVGPRGSQAKIGYVVIIAIGEIESKMKIKLKIKN
jgi:hypothetical protein